MRFVSEMTYNPASLLEMSARIIKSHNIHFTPGEIPSTLINYMRSAHHCVNPNCKGNKSTSSNYALFISSKFHHEENIHKLWKTLGRRGKYYNPF